MHGSALVRSVSRSVSHPMTLALSLASSPPVPPRAQLLQILHCTPTPLHPPSPDIYCYSCDDLKVDPELAAHMSHFGINIATEQKTEKSMAELVSLLFTGGAGEE